MSGLARWLGSGAESCSRSNALVLDPLVARRSWRAWWIAITIAFLWTVTFGVTIALVLSIGIGELGNNTTVVWGFPIANYVWWIGIGNAGTLISAMLLITRQHWRASINRSAEAMTLMAVSIAGLFPIIHLGRPLYFLWLLPYPNEMGIWPQWRSALIWDFWAILSYLLFSIIFWYTGLIPDLAVVRDAARTRFGRLFYGSLCFGWRNSARHWRIHQRFYYTMAGLAVPLVCSVHSIVGLDFAASLMPGWEEGIFPPYFVVGAMFSGFAMVAVLIAGLRWGFGFAPIITEKHFDMIGRMMLLASLVLGLTYLTEWFTAWYSGDYAERRFTIYEMVGRYAPEYWLMICCNVIFPQAFWWRAVRQNIPVSLVIAVLVNVGMWLERILIVWTTLSHSYSPTMWTAFLSTAVDWAMLGGSLGFFAFLYLCFVRIVPAATMFEVRELVHERRQELKA
ncbi:MAG TPA: NrfD/PsrC family molybdoenzyme membrane anchor subunit [Rhizomicrobium sp.]|nr:NrfD/PsrC family molybdoenzyme membrane anchor subunit [Rhizomicrobium sp.]